MIVLLMGVTGAGKTTVGELLAAQLGWGFADADSFHSAANVEKMREGISLTDADRDPWLAAIRDAMVRWDSEKRNAVLACSALKRSYRDFLSQDLDVKVVYLKGSYELISGRLQHRTGHYATAEILAGQFGALEEPDRVVEVDISKSPEEIVSEIREALKI